MTIDFSGKSVLVTGGSGGIGRAICKVFAKANANVTIHYNTNRKSAENQQASRTGVWTILKQVWKKSPVCSNEGLHCSNSNVSSAGDTTFGCLRSLSRSTAVLVCPLLLVD